ncbi:AsmA family protein [Humitalea sp. 24SJ18S-53]|uniref:AsmA family protein n=1 Tax=Humitalea sp. 24SJ18S-53 TaxID=3422307 RepID=UPI003D671542
MTLKRLALFLLALPALLLAGAVAWLLLVFDADSLRPRLMAEAERATGRRVTIDGPLKLGLFPLSVAAGGVSLANLPGGSRPEMLTLRRAEAEVAFGPLLRGQVVVSALRLTGADLLLERRNWIFERPPTPAAPASAPTAPRDPGPAAFRLDNVVLTDARVAAAGQRIDIAQATLRAGTHFAAEARWRDQPLRLTAQAGALTATPWPLTAEATAEGIALRFEGSAPGPDQWDAAEGMATLRLDRAARLAPLLPAAATWPAMQDITISAALRPGRAIGALRLEVAQAAQGPARLEMLRLAAEGPEAPITGTANLRLGLGLLALELTAGPAARFWPGRPASDWPMGLVAQGEGLTITANGVLGASGGPGAGNFALRAADLGATGRRLGLPFPALRDVSVSARATPEGDGIRLAPFELASASGDLAGDILLQPGTPPRVTAQLRGQRLDLDATMAALAVPIPAAPAAPAAPLVAPPLPRPGPARVIPDLPLPTDWLARLPVAGEAGLGLGELVWNGVTYRDLDLRAVLAPGSAILDPFAVTLPGGQVALRIEATPARLALRASTQDLDTAAFETAYGLPRRLSGPLELDLDLAGPAGGLRAWLAGASGHLGLAMLGGRLEPAMVAGIPPQLLSLLLPGGMPAEGIAQRCTALWLRIGDGAARIETLLVEGALGRLGGTGAIGLADEALNLRLLPDLRLGQVNVRAPVGVVGTLAAPRVGQVDARGAAAGALGALLSLQRTPDRRLGALAEDLSNGGPALPDCAPALTAARGGRAGPVPPPRDAEPAPRVTTQDLLRGLLGR